MKKSKTKSNLVCQYLENISRKALEKYLKLLQKYVRDKHGIYALYRNNRLYYIGLASNLRSRLRHHLRDRHANAWDSFSVYLTAGGEHLHELETLLLRIIEKKGNKQKGKFGKAEDLRRKLRNDLKKALSVELEDIFRKSSNETEIEESLIRKNIETKEGRRPTLAPFVNSRFHIRYRHKGKLYIAHVRKNGTISFAGESAESNRLQGKIFTSPSLAASEITRRQMNGWSCWTYEKSPGKWVKLEELRK